MMTDLASGGNVSKPVPYSTKVSIGKPLRDVGWRRRLLGLALSLLVLVPTALFVFYVSQNVGGTFTKSTATTFTTVNVNNYQLPSEAVTLLVAFFSIFVVIAILALGCLIFFKVTGIRRPHIYALLGFVFVILFPVMVWAQVPTMGQSSASYAARAAWFQTNYNITDYSNLPDSGPVVLESTTGESYVFNVKYTNENNLRRQITEIAFKQKLNK
jgi:glucan phosphoethanolaminetransferase (alkaline phosphatase superfamily)